MHVSHPAIAQAVQVPAAAGVVVLAVYLNPALQVSHSSALVAKVQVPQLETPHATQPSGVAEVSKTNP